jgi:hypothetical protein
VRSNLLTAIAIAAITTLAAGQARAEYTYTTISDPFATGYTLAIGINDSGEVSGYYSDGTGTHGFVETNGTYVTINDPSGLAGSTIVKGINNNGDVTGWYSTSTGTTGFVRDKNGIYTNLSDPVAYLNTVSPVGINDSGKVTGWSWDATARVNRAFIDTNGSYVAVNDPAGPKGTVGIGINNSGQIAGYYYDSTGVTHGFLRDASGNFTNFATPTGSLTYVDGLNGAGQVVGTYSDSSGTNNGFLRNVAGGFTTIDDPAGKHGTSLGGINDLGQIAGAYADSSGIVRGFIATPVPEPGSMAVLGSALFATGMVKRRRRVRCRFGSTPIMGTASRIFASAQSRRGNAAGYDRTQYKMFR